MLPQYHVVGPISYLLFCPKAPDVELCEPPAACEGHEFLADVDCYVEAPDEERAEFAALKKLAGPYPWPRLLPALRITPAALPTCARISRGAPAGPPLPGFEDALGSVTLSRGDQSVTLYGTGGRP